jgi:hypothetical protein
MKYAIGFVAALILALGYTLGYCLQDGLIAGYLGNSLVPLITIASFALGKIEG